MAKLVPGMGWHWRVFAVSANPFGMKLARDIVLA